MLFILFSVLVYLQLGAIFTVFGVAVGILYGYPSLKSTYGLYKARKDLTIGWSEADKAKSPDDTEAGANLADRRSSDNESECVYSVEEVYRVTRPTPKLCWLMFSLEVAFLYVYPLVALFAVGNYPLGIMFTLFAGITMLRYYVNAAVVLEETGRMDLVDGVTEYELWKNQSRLNEIVGNITTGRSLGVWISVLGSLGFIFLALTLGAVGSSTQEQAVMEQPKIFLDDFEYVQTDTLRYPSCQLSNALGNSPLVAMAGTYLPLRFLGLGCDMVCSTLSLFAPQRRLCLSRRAGVPRFRDYAERPRRLVRRRRCGSGDDCRRLS